MTSYDLRARLGLFPTTARLVPASGGTRLDIGSHDLASLVERFGTPLYLYDQATMDAALAVYRAALQQYYAGPSGITYAGKAFLCTAMAQWATRQGLWLDCTGVGELRVAAAAGVARDQIVVHGVNKGRDDVDAALAQAGTIVVDGLGEVQRLSALAQQRAGVAFPEVWLRVRPGLAVETHAHTQTGQKDSKFGMDWDETAEAVRICQQAGLPLTGLHFHQGSHFHDPAPLGPALDGTLDLVAALRVDLGWLPDVICPGGGWGVAYHEDELPHPSVEGYVRFVGGRLAAGCRERGLPLPRLHLEPGRSIVAQAGVALYRVGAVKYTAGRRWLLVDGGLADNPRPALYGARYSAIPVAGVQRPATGPAWLAGPYCESGDILIKDLPMPEIEPGELVAVPVSGAYQLSMASNYNGARKPAVVWLAGSSVHLVQKRETVDDLVRRDNPLPAGQGEQTRHN
jgi:diaminopimelate decarboxylase